MLHNVFQLGPRARTVLDTLLPTDGDLPGIFEAGFEAWHESWLDTAPPLMIVGFHVALAASVWVAPVLAGKLPPITRYDRPTREAILEAFGKSEINAVRQIALVLKITTSFAYGERTDVRRAVGYPRQFDDPDQGGERVTPPLVPELSGGA